MVGITDEPLLDRALAFLKRSLASHLRWPGVSADEICNACRVLGLSRCRVFTIQSRSCGSARPVSTRDQHPGAQQDALRAAGCEQVFIDKASGKLAPPARADQALLSANRAGDQLVVTKLDRARAFAGASDRAVQAACRAAVSIWSCSTRGSTPPPRWAGCSSNPGGDRGVRARADVRAHDGRAGRGPGARADRAARSRSWDHGRSSSRRQMYDETGDDGKRSTVAQIAAEFGVTRPTIYRHLGKTTDAAPS